MTTADPTAPLLLRKARTVATVDSAGRHARFLARAAREEPQGQPEVAEEPQGQPEVADEWQPEAPGWQEPPEEDEELPFTAPDEWQPLAPDADPLFFASPDGLTDALSDLDPLPPPQEPQGSHEVAAEGPQASEGEERAEPIEGRQSLAGVDARAAAEEIMIRNALWTLGEQVIRLVGDSLADASRRRIMRQWQEGQK